MRFNSNDYEKLFPNRVNNIRKTNTNIVDDSIIDTDSSDDTSIDSSDNGIESETEVENNGD